MKKQFLKIAVVSFITCCFVVLLMGRIANAQFWNPGNAFNWGLGNMPQYNYNNNYNYNYNNDDDNLTRGAAWNQTQYGTDAYGGTWMMGQFGPDIGYGEEGMVYEYKDPKTGTYISYSSVGMGMGFGGPLMGYGGMYSNVAGQSYGAYAGGNKPQVQPTPMYDTQGYQYGDLWGNNTNMYQAQYNPMAGMMFGLGSMFGLGGGFNFGLGGFGNGYQYANMLPWQ